MTESGRFSSSLAFTGRRRLGTRHARAPRRRRQQTDPPDRQRRILREDLILGHPVCQRIQDDADQDTSSAHSRLTVAYLRVTNDQGALLVGHGPRSNFDGLQRTPLICFASRLSTSADLSAGRPSEVAERRVMVAAFDPAAKEPSSQPSPSSCPPARQARPLGRSRVRGHYSSPGIRQAYATPVRLCFDWCDQHHPPAARRTFLPLPYHSHPCRDQRRRRDGVPLGCRAHVRTVSCSSDTEDPTIPDNGARLTGSCVHASLRARTLFAVIRPRRPGRYRPVTSTTRSCYRPTTTPTSTSTCCGRP